MNKVEIMLENGTFEGPITMHSINSQFKLPIPWEHENH